MPLNYKFVYSSWFCLDGHTDGLLVGVKDANLLLFFRVFLGAPCSIPDEPLAVINNRTVNRQRRRRIYIEFGELQFYLWKGSITVIDSTSSPCASMRHNSNSFSGYCRSETFKVTWIKDPNCIIRQSPSSWSLVDWGVYFYNLINNSLRLHLTSPAAQPGLSGRRCGWRHTWRLRVECIINICKNYININDPLIIQCQVGQCLFVAPVHLSNCVRDRFQFP